EGVASADGAGVGFAVASGDGVGVKEGSARGDGAGVAVAVAGEVFGTGDGGGGDATVELPSPGGTIFFATSVGGTCAIGLRPTFASSPSVLPLSFLYRASTIVYLPRSGLSIE